MGRDRFSRINLDRGPKKIKNHYCKGLRTKIFNFRWNICIVTIRSLKTWLNNNIANGELNLYDYNIYRCDWNLTTSSCSRSGRILAGILIDLPSYQIPINCVGIEVIFVSFTLNRKKYIISNTYLPPNSSSFLKTFYTLRPLRLLFRIYFSLTLAICLFSVWILNDCHDLIYSSTPISHSNIASGSLCSKTISFRLTMFLINQNHYLISFLWIIISTLSKLH